MKSIEEIKKLGKAFVLVCRSQEEWDFACKIMNYGPNQNWFKDKQYGNNTCYCVNYYHASCTVDDAIHKYKHDLYETSDFMSNKINIKENYEIY